MNKHTPGPWEWWTSNSWRRLHAVGSRGESPSVLAPTVASDGHPDLIVSEADMQLIAAAPMLADALRAIAGSYPKSEEGETLADIAREALRKCNLEISA